MKKIREAVVSGIFYPDNAAELSAAVSSSLSKALPFRGKARAILSPHAGFDYSGAITAAAWMSAAERRPKTVVVLAPYHRAEESFVWLPESEAFSTPLGEIAVDSRYLEELESCGTIFRINDIPHFEEHDIEVQLPFLQTQFPEASLVPILLGKPTTSTIKTLAKSLNLVFSEDADSTLFVVSSNFSCFSSEEESKGRLERVLGFLSSGDEKGLYDEFRSDNADMCGIGCLTALLQSHLLDGASWNLLARGDSISRRASLSEKIVYYAAGAWK